MLLLVSSLSMNDTRDIQRSFGRVTFSFSPKDIGGVCRDVGEIIQFTAKTTGRELKKRDVTLVDRSSASVCIIEGGRSNSVHCFSGDGLSIDSPPSSRGCPEIMQTI